MPSTFNRVTTVATGICLSLVVSAAVAQLRTDGRGRGVLGWPFGFGEVGPLALLQRPDVQAELELLDEQKKELQVLVERSNDRRRDLFSGFADQFRNRDATSESDRAVLREKFADSLRTLNEEIETGLSFLLPHQRRRLEQLVFQYRLRSGGGAGSLVLPEFSERLGVTDEQREVLRQKAMELGREMAAKMAHLRREMHDKLMAELTAEQRAKFHEMTGDPFEFQDRPPGNASDRGPPLDGERP